MSTVKTIGAFSTPPLPDKGQFWKDEAGNLYILSGSSQPQAVRLTDGQTHNSHCDTFSAAVSGLSFVSSSAKITLEF